MARLPTVYFELSNAGDQRRFYDLFLLALVIWREARGETPAAKQGVAWAVKNRALKPSWWGGSSYWSVILHPFQFSSFNHGDPNATKWPVPSDVSWSDSLEVAAGVISGNVLDNTSGATSYFDKSLDSKPPTWATDGSNIHTCDIGGLRFYRLAT